MCLENQTATHICHLHLTHFTAQHKNTAPSDFKTLESYLKFDPSKVEGQIKKRNICEYKYTNQLNMNMHICMYRILHDISQCIGQKCRIQEYLYHSILKRVYFYRAASELIIRTKCRLHITKPFHFSCFIGVCTFICVICVSSEIDVHWVQIYQWGTLCNKSNQWELTLCSHRLDLHRSGAFVSFRKHTRIKMWEPKKKSDRT